MHCNVWMHVCVYFKCGAINVWKLPHHCDSAWHCVMSITDSLHFIWRKTGKGFLFSFLVIILNRLFRFNQRKLSFLALKERVCTLSVFFLSPNRDQHRCSFVTDKVKGNSSIKGSSYFLPYFRSADGETSHGCVWADSVQPGPPDRGAVCAVHSPRAGLQHAVLQWVPTDTHWHHRCIIIDNHLKSKTFVWSDDKVNLRLYTSDSVALFIL